MTETFNKIIKGDRTIVLLVLILMLFSALLMGSTTVPLAIQKTNFSFVYLLRQLFFSAFAFVIMIFVSKIPYQIYFKVAKVVLIISIGLILLTIVMGQTVNQAKRWLQIPVLGFSIQTSDIVRVALVIFVAKIISEYDAKKDDLREMFKKVMLWSLPVIFLVSINDFSTAFLMGLTVISMLFFTPIDLKFFFKVLGIMTLVAVVVFVIMLQFDFGRSRTAVSRIIGAESKKEYSQKTQGLIAVSNASIIPKPGKSKQKYLLASSYSDYIFSIALEEYGIIGLVLILGVYLIIMYRTAKIIRAQKRSFPMFLTLGLLMNIMTQAFMHIFVNVGILPVTGQPLPFVSMGGTSTIITAFEIGIILNISEKVYEQEKPATDNDDNIIEEPEIEIEDHVYLID